MSIEKTKVIDFIGIEEASNSVVLTISDYLFLLQEKLNNYLAFIESGELIEAYSDAKDKKPIISIIGKEPLPCEGEKFIRQASKIMKEEGIELRFIFFGENE